MTVDDLFEELAVPDAPPTGEEVAMSAVDDALRVAARRELFTRNEALGLLHQVEGSTHDLGVGPTVASIVESFDRATTDQLMCSHADLVNPLLDIRLAMGGVRA
jgi:hypothetical protein